MTGKPGEEMGTKQIKDLLGIIIGEEKRFALKKLKKKNRKSKRGKGTEGILLGEILTVLPLMRILDIADQEMTQCQDTC